MSVPYSPPYKKNFIYQTSPIYDTSETLEDNQNLLIIPQDNILTPHPSFNLPSPILSLLKVTYDIHPPPTPVPPTPCPPSPSQHIPFTIATSTSS